MDALLSIGRSKGRRLEGRVFYACRKSRFGLAATGFWESSGWVGASASGFGWLPTAGTSLPRKKYRRAPAVAVRAALDDDGAAVGEAERASCIARFLEGEHGDLAASVQLHSLSWSGAR